MTLLKTNTEKAILLALVSFAAFSLSDGMRKVIAQDHEVIDILFWQAICGMIALILATAFMGGVKSLIDLQNIKWHLVRGGLMALNTIFSLQAISRIPITDAYMIFFLTPFVISILAVFMFGEAIGKYRLISILIGFSGAFIAFRPGFVEVNPAYIYAVICVFSFSFASLLARYIGHVNGLLCFAFWPALFLIIGIFIYKGGQISLDFDPAFFLYVCVAGVAYALAMITISYSFNLAPAAVVVPFQYVQIVFALGFDYFIWAIIPDPYRIVGAIIIVGAGVFLFARERNQKERNSDKSIVIPE